MKDINFLKPKFSSHPKHDPYESAKALDNYLKLEQKIYIKIKLKAAKNCFKKLKIIEGIKNLLDIFI